MMKALIDTVKALKPLKYLKTALSGSDEASWGRLGATSVLLMTYFWVTYLVIRNGTLPDMAGPSTFVASGVAACYGINKVAEYATDKKKGTTEVAPDVDPMKS